MNIIRNHFDLDKLGTNIKIEFLAGLTTFVVCLISFLLIQMF